MGLKDVETLPLLPRANHASVPLAQVCLGSQSLMENTKAAQQHKKAQQGQFVIIISHWGLIQKHEDPAPGSYIREETFVSNLDLFATISSRKAKLLSPKLGRK